MKYFIVLLTFIIGCKYHGTDTGNASPNPVAITSDYASENIKQNICFKLMICNSTSHFDECMEKGNEALEFASKLGLPDEYNALTLGKIIEAEQLGNIVANKEVVGECTSDIQALSCNDMGLLEAYDIGLTNPYQNMNLVLLPICMNVF
ncbi:MAG: hypothetical protein H6623_08345 [Bdellovibrionaceae bacterium]|nr:hypothetical protein [Pseudobdellovibrionaceae bacterium]